MNNPLCRICGYKNLKKKVDFGKVPLGNNLQEFKKAAHRAKLYELALLNCPKCDHVQLSNKVNKKELYQNNYTYLSSTGLEFKNHLSNYCDEIVKITKLKKNSLVIDVGSNDGTCLSFFKKKNYKILGVDPAHIPAQIAIKSGIKTIESFFNRKVVNHIKENYGKADLITSHNVLAHVESLEEIFLNIFDCLKDNGYFCFEVGYFIEVLKKQLFDTIYHEHIDYHKASPLVYLLSKIGFSIISIKKNKIQGGSLRILCKKKNNIKIYSQPTIFMHNEKKFLINKDYNLKNWTTIIERKMSTVLEKFNLFAKYKEFKIIGYGAPTKSTLMIKISKINFKKIEYIVEDNLQKIDRYIPKYGIPIKRVNRNNINSANLIFIFAWNFQHDIIKNLKEIYNYNGFVLIPLPNVRLIKL